MSYNENFITKIVKFVIYTGKKLIILKRSQTLQLGYNL